MDASRDPVPVAGTVRDYYEALRRGEPLYPYFYEDESVAKFGVCESLSGYDAVAEALREQTRTTEDWHVESHALRAGRIDDQGWFADVVDLAWTGAEGRRSFSTRWSGSLRRRDDEWVFLALHVSTATDPAAGAVAVPGETGESGGE